MVTYASPESAEAAVKLDRSIISGNSRFVESWLSLCIEMPPGA